MEFKLVNKPPTNKKEYIICLATVGKKKSIPHGISIEVKKVIDNALKEEPKLLDLGKMQTLTIYNKEEILKVVVAGLGDLNKYDKDKVTMLGGSIVRACSSAKMKKPIMFLPEEALEKNVKIINSLVEGMCLGNYDFTEFKTDKNKEKIELEEVSIFATDDKLKNKYNQMIAEAQIIANCVNTARDLINRPGNVVNPTYLAEQAMIVAKKAQIDCKVLEKKDMEKLAMGALLSVTQGSEQLPKLIVLDYKGNSKSKEKIALVGKGVTFDSGGISIKPSGGMEEMKDDMGGAAAVMLALNAIATLKLPVNVVGVIPCVENMPSGQAARPGDVVKSAAGKTIEIISTDAEGRMILADAVWYADEKLDATSIIDIATLTGAASIALGDFISGVVTNNQKLCDKVVKAGLNTGEQCWQMPSSDEFKEYNKSDVADIKNSGGRSAGMITGGLFIGEFTKKPWVHIDIGNTVSSKSTKGYKVKGPNGVGVRLLVEVARLISNVG